MFYIFFDVVIINVAFTGQHNMQVMWWVMISHVNTESGVQSRQKPSFSHNGETAELFFYYYFYIFSRFIMRRTFQWLHNTNQPFLELTSLSCSSSQFSRILLSHLPTKAPSQSLKKIAASGGSKPRRSRPCQVLHLKTRLLLNQRWII